MRVALITVAAVAAGCVQTVVKDDARAIVVVGPCELPAVRQDLGCERYTETLRVGVEQTFDEASE